MEPKRIGLAVALICLLVTPLASAGERVVLYEETFARGFVGNQQEYLVIFVDERHDGIRLEVECNLHTGVIALYSNSGSGSATVVCDGLFERVILDHMEPGYWYGVASFSGVNGVVVRVTAVG